MKPTQVQTSFWPNSGKPPPSERNVAAEELATKLTSRAAELLALDHATRLASVRALIGACKENDRGFVEEIIAFLNAESSSQSGFLIIESTLYFDNIGDAKRAAEISQLGVEISLKFDDLDLQRKAANVAGVMSSRICDFEQACLYLEKALSLAIALRNKCCEFATLCNVVSTLELMGLRSDALRLSRQLARSPDGVQELDYLHLQNAINGLRLSLSESDFTSADFFEAIAYEKVSCSGLVGRPWKAYVDAYRTLRLVTEGRSEAARELIASALGSREDESNVRVNSILYCAYASCAIARANLPDIRQSKSFLTDLLKRTKHYAFDHENVLRALVALYGRDSEKKGKSLATLYQRQLTDHLVNVKHRQFFNRISTCNTDADDSIGRIASPSYKLPDRFAAIVGAGSPSPKWHVSRDQDVVGISAGFSNNFYGKVENRLRSEAYQIAEDWAVAADFAATRQGSHCFDVANLAGLIAAQLGYSNEGRVLIEMACRLHDIGKLAVDAALQRSVNAGVLDGYLVIVEHSSAGARLLGSSSDVVLQLASRVARHHHEWWNGCGLPDALEGEAIPIEARICSIADAYLALVHPSEPQTPWSEEAALQQVVSMAGVQLDPNLMASFLIAVEVYNTAKLDEKDVLRPLELNSLVIAKQQLLDAVKLVS